MYVATPYAQRIDEIVPDDAPNARMIELFQRGSFPLPLRTSMTLTPPTFGRRQLTLPFDATGPLALELAAFLADAYCGLEFCIVPHTATPVPDHWHALIWPDDLTALAIVREWESRRINATLQARSVFIASDRAQVIRHAFSFRHLPPNWHDFVIMTPGFLANDGQDWEPAE